MKDFEHSAQLQTLSQLIDGEWYEINQSDCVAKLCGDPKLKAKWERYHLIRDALKQESVQINQSLAARVSAALADEPTYSNVTPFASTSDPQSLDTEVPVDVELAVSSQDTSAVASTASLDEPTDDTDQLKRASWFNTGITGFALAASVALVTVVGLNYFDQHGAGNINTTVAENSEQLPGKLTGQNPKLDGLQQTTVNDQAVAVAGSSSEATSAFSRQIDGASLPVVDYVSNVGSYWVSPESSERVRDEQRLNMMLSRHLDNSPTSGREGLLPYSRLVGYDEMVKNRQAPAGR